MGTIVAIETDGGFVLAGDRRVTRDGTVVSESADHVFDFDDIGAGAVGEEGDVNAFRRQLEAELKEFELERDREVTVEELGRIAARIADDSGVEAVVATHDDEGVARGRRVGPDGSVLSDSVFAIGSGAQVALGRLESADRNRDLPSTEAFVRDVMETVAERDPDSGENVDLWSLANDSASS